MELDNLNKVKEERITKNLAPLTKDTLPPILTNELDLGPIAVRQAQHLDVDEILRRSLPRLSQPTDGSQVNKVTY